MKGERENDEIENMSERTREGRCEAKNEKYVKTEQRERGA